MKHLEKDWLGRIVPKKNNRLFSFGFNGYKGGEIWIEECCDSCFSAEYSKVEFLEMLDEIKHIVESGDQSILEQDGH